MVGAVKLIGGWVAGKGVEGKIKDLSAIHGLRCCLHIVFWGSPKNGGSATFLCKTRAICRFSGGAICKYAPLVGKIPVFIECGSYGRR